jgi:hypothetical protein
MSFPAIEIVRIKDCTEEEEAAFWDAVEEDKADRKRVVDEEAAFWKMFEEAQPYRNMVGL